MRRWFLVFEFVSRKGSKQFPINNRDKIHHPKFLSVFNITRLDNYIPTLFGGPVKPICFDPAFWYQIRLDQFQDNGDPLFLCESGIPSLKSNSLKWPLSPHNVTNLPPSLSASLLGRSVFLATSDISKQGI